MPRAELVARGTEINSKNTDLPQLSVGLGGW